MSKCKACGTDIAWNTKRCPNCSKRIIHPVIGTATLLFCLVFVFVFVFPFLTKHAPEYGLGKPPDAPTVPVSETSNSAEITNAPAPKLDDETSGSIMGPGTYTVGTDIDAGTYDCVAVSGFGVLRGSIAEYGAIDFVQTMGVESDVIDCAHEYNNLKLTDGDILYVEMNLKVDLQKN